jgi:predicted enzyme related to lactoylglutathione lyase
LKVAESKAVKNRVHVCLNARSVDDEAERLMALGAQKAEVHSSSSGSTWLVMRDPEGNEFCLLPTSRVTWWDKD